MAPTVLLSQSASGPLRNTEPRVSEWATSKSDPFLGALQGREGQREVVSSPFANWTPPIYTASLRLLVMEEGGPPALRSERKGEVSSWWAGLEPRPACGANDTAA